MQVLLVSRFSTSPEGQTGNYFNYKVQIASIRQQKRWGRSATCMNLITRLHAAERGRSPAGNGFASNNTPYSLFLFNIATNS
jgi:hypothetical protein